LRLLKKGSVAGGVVSGPPPSVFRLLLLYGSNTIPCFFAAAYYERKIGRRPHGPQTPCKQPPISGCKRDFAGVLLTRDFLYSMVTFLTDAPFAYLDSALDRAFSGVPIYLLNKSMFLCVDPSRKVDRK
jgi:hypothetical protein